MNSILYPTKLVPIERHDDSLLACILGFHSAANNVSGETMHTKALS